MLLTNLPTTVHPNNQSVSNIYSKSRSNSPTLGQTDKLQEDGPMDLFTGGWMVRHNLSFPEFSKLGNLSLKGLLKRCRT